MLTFVLVAYCLAYIIKFLLLNKILPIEFSQDISKEKVTLYLKIIFFMKVRYPI